MQFATVTIPGDDSFQGEAFQDGGALQNLAGDMIEQFDELRHLYDYQMAYLWKKKASTSKGEPVWGAAELAGGKLRHFAGATFIVTLPADLLREYPDRLEPLLYQQLLKCDQETLEDGENRPRIAAYDFQGFTGEIRRFGAWNTGLKSAQTAIMQLELPFEVDELEKTPDEPGEGEVA